MSITSRNEINGLRSEHMRLVPTLKFEWMNVLQIVFFFFFFLLKTNGKCADQAGWKKCILVSTFVVCMQRHFCLWRRFYVLLAVECLWMIKLNKTIISVLVYADTIKASLYFQLKWYFSNFKVYYKKGVVKFCDLNFMKTAEFRNWH